ncbi:MAG TPA: hypothetical protein VKU41_31350 [Polyangiaceae bacterium]|nr:hypothetical protein [Polyangiaceae bacterium]
MKGFARAARGTAVVACGAIGLAGVFAGAVRVLPWLLDPAVPWRVAAPFARGLGAVALEAALVVGWPVGWALAVLRLVESGEARVLQALGERPGRTLYRLGPQGAAMALALAGVSLVYGADASAPGRVATDLLVRARKSCAAAREPKTYVVPFTEMTWLCAPGREPRLVGSAPGALASTLLTAGSARIAGDFREVDLDDARVLLPGPPPAEVHVGSLVLRGMAPWAHASTLGAPLRSLVLVLAAWLSAHLGALSVLRRAARTPLGVLLIGAAGPLASLGLMRVLERLDSGRASFLLVPLVGAACTSGVAVALSRLRVTGAAASTWVKIG